MERVLITGCSIGIGYQTALLLGEANFDVFATTRDPNFKFPNENIKNQYLDMLNLPDAIDDFDICIFNAGVLDAGLAEHMDEATISKMMEVNVISIMKMCQRVIPKMKEKKKGKLIFLSSMAASRPMPGLSVYNSSKAAIEAYAKSLYLELAPYQIDVYVIKPGFYKTSLWNHVTVRNDTYLQQLLKMGMNSKKNRDVSEVAKRIVDICLQRKQGFSHVFGFWNYVSLIISSLIYTKLGKFVFKCLLFKKNKG